MLSSRCSRSSSMTVSTITLITLHSSISCLAYWKNTNVKESMEYRLRVTTHTVQYFNYTYIHGIQHLNHYDKIQKWKSACKGTYQTDLSNLTSSPNLNGLLSLQTSIFGMCWNRRFISDLMARVGTTVVTSDKSTTIWI